VVVTVFFEVTVLARAGDFLGGYDSAASGEVSVFFMQAFVKVSRDFVDHYP